MSKFTIQVPDGRKVTVEAADEKQALAGVQDWYAQNSKAPADAGPPGKPGSREYADWAAQQARAGKALPQVSPTPPGPAMNPAQQLANTSDAFQSGAMQGMTLGFGDEINAALMSPIEMGIDAVQGKGFDPGRSYNQALAKNRGLDAREAALNPTANTIGEMTGGLATGGALQKGGLTLMAAAKPTVRSLLGRGAVEGAAYGGVYGAGKADGDLASRLQGAGYGAATGAVMGAVAPVLAKAGGDAVQGFLQNRATSAAIKGAPSAAELRQASSDLFKSVDRSGVTVDTAKFGTFVNDLATNAKKMRINPNLDPKAFGAYQELIGALGDVQANGAALTLSDLHTLRQIAQKAAVSTEGRDAMFANQIVDGLDGFIAKGGNLKLPANRVGAGSAAAGNDLLKAISTWGQSRRVSLVEEAIYKAANQASGLENGLRVQFRQLLQNKKTRSIFTQTELDAIEKVANGTATSNVARLIGKFGFGGGSASNMLGGTIGSSIGLGLGGPVGAVAAAVIGTGSKKLSGVMATQAAERAAKIVATPNIPNVTLNNPFMRLGGAGAPLALPLAPRPRPLEITVRGGQ